MFSSLKEEIELLKRHVKILRLVKELQPVGIIKLSEISGMPQHKVRYSLRILEKRGIIRPSSSGAVITPKAEEVLSQLEGEIEAIKKELDECLS